MDTSAVSNDVSNDVNAGSADIAIKPENVTYKRFVRPDAEGRVDPSVKGAIVYASGGKKLETYEADPTYTLAGTITVRDYSIGTLEGLAELIGDKDEAVIIANKGLTQKSNQKTAEYVLAFDVDTQAFVNAESADVFDLREALQEATQRRNLSPVDRAIRSVKNMSADDRAAIMQLLAQLQSAQ